jgi:hypothetical protein
LNKELKREPDAELKTILEQMERDYSKCLLVDVMKIINLERVDEKKSKDKKEESESSSQEEEKKVMNEDNTIRPNKLRVPKKVRFENSARSIENDTLKSFRKK